MIDKKLVIMTIAFSLALTGLSFMFGEYYAVTFKAEKAAMVMKNGRSRFPASVGEKVPENAPPLMEHFKTFSYVAEGCDASFAPELDVDCGPEGHMIHLYLAWDPSTDGRASGKPWLGINNKKVGDFTSTNLNENKPGTHEYYSVCKGKGKMVVHIPTKCTPGLNYSVRIDEDGYVSPVDPYKS
jgi:hypothetical protein